MTELAAPAATPRSARARAVAVTGLGSAASGLLVGALWAGIAPPIGAVVALTRQGERVHDYLGNESEHFFDAPCLMLGLLTALAVVSAVLVWQWRAHRGPGMLVALSVGMVAAAAVATAVGAALVRLRYGALDFDAVPLVGKPSVAYVRQAPPVLFARGMLHIALTLVWPGGIAALVYAALAAADARDDLGALRMVDEPEHALPATPGGATGASVL